MNFVVLDNFDFRIDSHFHSTIIVVVNIIFNEFHHSILKYINSHIIMNNLIFGCNNVTKNESISSTICLKFDDKWKIFTVLNIIKNRISFTFCTHPFLKTNSLLMCCSTLKLYLLPLSDLHKI